MDFKHLTPEQRLDLAMRGVKARNIQRKEVGSKPIPQFCKRGHEMNEENTHIGYRKTGVRAGERIVSCRTCISESGRRHRLVKSRAKRDAL